jgi:hypothetical protein
MNAYLYFGSRKVSPEAAPGAVRGEQKIGIKRGVRLPDTKSQQLAASPGTAVEPAFWSEVVCVEPPC